MCGSADLDPLRVAVVELAPSLSAVVELDAGTLLSVAMAVLPVDQATDLVAKLQEVDIFYLKILSAPTVSSFTGLRSTLDVSYEASSPVWDILGLDVKALTEASEDPDVRAAVGRFASLAKDKTTAKRLARELKQLSDEKSQLLAVIREVLLPLTGQENMMVNIREYPESVVMGEPVHRIHLGMGSALTWHGAPDGRCAIDLVNVDAVEEEGDSSGSKTPVEMKIAFGRPNINQVLGNAVIFSFVQQKRHPTTNPLVPVMGISGNEGSVLFAAYDARSDILLHSVPTTWLDFRSNQFNLTGLFFMWLGLHHRIFLRRTTGDEPHSGLHERLTRDGALEHFQQLSSMSVKYWSLPQISYSAPRLKRRRTEEKN